MNNTLLDRLIDLYLQNGVNLQKHQHLYLSIPREHHALAALFKEKVETEYQSTIEVEETDQLLDIVKNENFHVHEYTAYLQNIYADKIKSLSKDTVYLELRPGMEAYQDEFRIPLNKLYTVLSDLQNEFRIARRAKGNVRTCKSVIPTKYWAETIYPQQENPLAYLWEVYFHITLADQNDAVAQWQKRIHDLQRRVNYLNTQQFQSLIFQDHASFLNVELLPDHNWTGGCEITEQGIAYMPNFPTQEIFSAPKKTGVNGIFKNSVPLCYKNQIIDDFYIVFKNGKVVSYDARQNLSLLKEIICFDENSSYVGEIAILPGITEIAKSNTVFQTTLLDENTACHLALGRAYQCSCKNKVQFDPKSYAENQMNYSGIHVDMMFGTKSINIHAITKQGETVEIIVAGKWCI